jgi:hypothetical protein
MDLSIEENCAMVKAAKIVEGPSVSCGREGILAIKITKMLIANLLRIMLPLIAELSSIIQAHFYGSLPNKPIEKADYIIPDGGGCLVANL